MRVTIWSMIKSMIEMGNKVFPDLGKANLCHPNFQDFILVKKNISQFKENRVSCKKNAYFMVILKKAII